jgi:GNAT superfamily N-acetyltransferase
MTIRYAKPSDFDFLIKGLEENRRLEQRSSRDVKATRQDTADFRLAILSHLIRVLEDQGRLIGFLYFRTDFPVMYIPKKPFWIDLIYVERRFRGKGVGRLLYKDAITTAKRKGFKTLVIDVFEANVNSKAFHERLGFHPIYTIYRKRI